jgi:hypothetical protein
MKTIRIRIVAKLLALGSTAMAAQAADYSQMSIEELLQQRERARAGELTMEEREVFRSEMQRRVRSMDDQERATFREQNWSGGRGKGSGQRSGDGARYRYGQGADRQNTHRYGPSWEMNETAGYRGRANRQGYGSGYGFGRRDGRGRR